MTPDLFALVRVLSSAGVDYIIVRGVAGNRGWCRSLNMIALKRAAGRGKDREALAELEALLEERDR